MGVSERTSKITSVIAAICIVIYILAIASGIVQIIENTGERRNMAESEFHDLADRASSSAVILGFMSDSYKKEIQAYLDNSRTLLGVIITAADGEYGFERYTGSCLVWAGNSPRFNVKAGYSGEPFYMPLRIDGQRNVNIQALYSYLDYNVFLRVLRNTLIVVLGALVIAFITLLAELAIKNKASMIRSGAYVPQKGDEPDIPVPDEQPDDKPEVQPNEEDHFSEEFDFSPFAEETVNVPADEETAGITSEMPENVRTGAALHPEQRPQGLYTPRGNIGWESYTHDRLSSELQRCASFEQDLVLLLMDIKGSSVTGDALYRHFTDEAVNFFGMRDLIFEKGEKGISVIIPNMDLEQGILKAEDFRGKVITRLAELPELCIGLSTRSGRIIEAGRLMREASRALEKAMEDPASPIIAFKSDPEKYREFIAKQPERP